MNEKKLRQFTAYACFGFALFCLLWVIFTYLLLPVAEGQKDYALMVNDPEWIYVSLTGLVSSIFGIFAVFGIVHANREHGGMFLFIGVVILVLGLLLEMASLTWDTFIWPVLCANENFISFVRVGSNINIILSY